MAQAANIESDPLFQLLTDALRAGPQSAEWAEAVARIRDGGSTEADEYKALLQARENLESGKEYKAVRAGAGFTRDLFGKIDEEKEAAKAKGLPTATLLAIGAGIVILGVIAVVAVMLNRGGGGTSGGETLPSFFSTMLVSTTFAPGDKGMTITGAGATDTSGGLKPGTDALVDRPIEGRFEIEADVKVPPGSSEVALVKVLVPGGGTAGAKTLEQGWPSWELFGGNQRVTVGDSTKLIVPAPTDGKITVRLVVGKTKAAVYSNKELLWSGEHGLPAGPRTPGVQITPAKAGAGSVPVITAVRVRAESKSAAGGN